jgi:nucleoside permease NupC
LLPEDWSQNLLPNLTDSKIYVVFTKQHGCLSMNVCQAYELLNGIINKYNVVVSSLAV